MASKRIALLTRVTGTLALIAAASAAALQTQAGVSAPRGRVVLHAHNCFPEEGHWADRLDRALGTGVQPIAIEQDLVWFVDPATRRGRSVLSHSAVATATDPSLEDYFFARVRPVMERALAAGRRDAWPVVFLHFNIRNNEAAHLQSIWNLLGRYESWLTTAERAADDQTVMPLRPGPLMVLTEGGQEEVLHNRVPVGGRLRVFATMPAGRAVGPAPADREAQATAAVETPPNVLIPARATNYRRWVNFSWAVVERGGQGKAADWTPADAARLQALVDRAHAMNLGIRFYTLNGHAPEAGLGWSAGYNFGSVEAARIRWRAAIDAGVDLLATDQYELLAEELKRSRSK
jgi:hypothetical protein